MLLTAAAMLILPASAYANLDLTGSHAEPQDLDAGAHSNFKIHAQFGSEDVKDLTISLPPGEVGNPLATPLCDPGTLPSCPANTAVGTVSSNVTIGTLLPQTISGTVYNLVPQPGEPARFGIVLNALPISLPAPLNGLVLPPTVVQSGASLRQDDFGLDTVVHNIPHEAALIGGLPITVPVHISSMDLTLNGMAGGNPFMRNPTSCDAHTVRFSGNSYSSPIVVHKDSPAFTPTNCGALDFSPAFEAQVGGDGQTTNGVPTTASTSILQDTDEAGLLNAKVTVPNDLNPNATVFFGGACDLPSFTAGTCPSNTVVGFATAASPLLSQPLVGNVELVASGGTFPNLGLDLKGQLHLLLQGATAINPNTVTFEGLPDIPISRFQLTFTPSPGLLGTSRDLCVGAPPVFHADFTGYNGASTSVDAAATVIGCGGSTTGGGTKGAAKCKKAKKKRKHRAAEAKKKHKKSCKKKKRKKRR
jgi:hypothetical protein